MATIQRFEDIEAWQKARELTRRIYEISKTGPFAKDFGLRDQIRRSSVSAMSNIAEGFERGKPAEFAQFLGYAKGSAGEVESQLYVTLDQKYVTDDEFKIIRADAQSVKKLISGFLAYLKRPDSRGHYR